MEHERKLIFLGDLAPYRDSVSGQRAKQYQRLLAEADRVAALDLPREHPKASTTYMGIAMVNLSLAYLLSGEEKYLAGAKRFMATVLGYEKWGNAYYVNVDLSATWILFGLSLGYDWLKPWLSQVERRRVAEKLAHHAQVVYDYRRETYGHGWSTNFFQNHNWINMTGLAAAGYALRGENDMAQTFIREAREDFERVFSLMAEDGSNYEGCSYWRYGGMWLFVAAHLWKVQEGIDYFKTCPYLQNTFYYRLYQSTGDFECQLNFGDCHDHHSSHAPCVYYKTAAEYRDGHAQRLANLVLDEFLEAEATKSGVVPGILPEAAFEFLWYDPTVEERDFDDLPLTRYFPDLGLLSIRSGWNRAARVLSIKCSPPGGWRQWEKGWEIAQAEGIQPLSLSHHHPDNLAYIFVQGGTYFTCEDGYNRNIMPDNHNVLLVDGVYTDAQDVSDVYMTSVKKRLAEQKNFSPETYVGRVTAMEVRDGLVLYRGETAGVYPAARRMNEVSRLLVTDALKFWVFVDVLHSDMEHVYSVLCNTEPAAIPDGAGYRYPMATGDIRCRVFSDRPIRCEQYDQQVAAIMTPQEPDKVTRTNLQTLRTQSAGAERDQVFFECFTFADSDASVQAQGRSLTLTCGGETYRIDVGEYDPVTKRTPITVSVGPDGAARFAV